MKQPFICKKPDTAVFMNKSGIVFFALFLTLKCSQAQFIYPPNFSFENDTTKTDISPWKVIGDCFFANSVWPNSASDGKLFVGISSEKKGDTIRNSKLSIRFPINQRISGLYFESLFFSSVQTETFDVSIVLTHFNPALNKNQVVCRLDSAIDTIANYRNYRQKWVNQRLILDKYYLSDTVPDSCYIEFTCNVWSDFPYDMVEELCLDNVRLTPLYNSTVMQLRPGDHLAFFPNPTARDLFLIPEDNRLITYIEIIDQSGRIVHYQEFQEKIHHLDLENLSNGFYIIKLQLDSGEFMVRKFEKINDSISGK